LAFDLPLTVVLKPFCVFGRDKVFRLGGWSARRELVMDELNSQERRSHRRLEIRLPLEYQRAGLGRANVSRTMTINVSTGGVYFETASEDIKVGDKLTLELAVPPGDGRFPQHSRIITVGQVVRTSVIDGRPNDQGHTFTRHGVAARFQQGFKLTFTDSMTASGYSAR
jgi:hypothetical protein